MITMPKSKSNTSSGRTFEKQFCRTCRRWLQLRFFGKTKTVCLDCKEKADTAKAARPPRVAFVVTCECCKRRLQHGREPWIGGLCVDCWPERERAKWSELWRKSKKW